MAMKKTKKRLGGDFKMTPFAAKVIRLIHAVPRGRVATYGQIAKAAGKPHASRAVGWILHACARSYRLPWQRILNSKGAISFHPGTQEYATQKYLLRKEGVEFSSEHGLDLKIYQWKI